MKLTEWYSGDQKPVRAGVYERLYMERWWNGQRTGFSGYCHFDGEKFFEQKSNLKHAQFFGSCRFTEKPSEHQNLPWRGIAK